MEIWGRSVCRPADDPVWPLLYIGMNQVTGIDKYMIDAYGNPALQRRCQPVWNSYQNSIYTATAVYPHTMAGVHGCVPGCIDPRTIGRVYFTLASASRQGYANPCLAMR